MMKRALLAVMLLCLAGAAQAEAKKEKAVIQMSPIGSINEQVQRVEEALRSEDYSEIPLEKRSAAQQALGRIKLKMEGHDRIDQVSPQVRTDIFNDQQQINLILSQGHEDSRMICRRERMTGSNFPQNVCMTVAQRRAQQLEGRKLLDNNMRSHR